MLAPNKPRAHLRRFSPLSPNDLAVVPSVMAGEHAIRGFRNADVTARLYRRPAADRDEAHRRCERVSRLIVKLRGHCLVAKIPRARPYRVTHYGHRVMTAAITLHDRDYPVRYMTAPEHSRSCLSRRANLRGIGLIAGRVRQAWHPLDAAGLNRPAQCRLRLAARLPASQPRRSTLRRQR